MGILTYFKKFLSAVLVLAMCFSITTFPVVAEETQSEVSQVIDPAFAEKLELFKALEVFDENDTLSEGKSISRGEFVKYIVRLVGGTLGTQSESPFWDVTPNNEFYKEVCAAIGYGMINGNPDGSFAPYDYITCEQMVRITLNALGYGEYIQLKGNNTAALLHTAGKVDLNVNGKMTDFATSAMAVELLYEALGVPMLENSTFSSDTVSFENNGKLLLEVYRNIYTVSGVVTANRITSLSEKTAGNGQIRVGSTVINGAGNKASGLLGYNVDCYAKKNSTVYEMVYVIQNDDNDVTKFNLEDISDVTSSKITYYDGSRSKTVNLSASTKWIYNGVAVDFSKHTISDLLADDYGKAELIDNNSDGKDEVIKISSYDTIVVAFADFVDNKIYDKNSVLYNIDLEQYDEYDVCDVNGNVLKSLPENTVLTVMKSLDNEYVKLVSSDTKIESARIESVNSNGNLSVNGEWYEATDEFATQASASLLSAGAGGTFLLDMNRKIAYILEDAATDVSFLAYMIVVDTENGLSNSVKVKLFNQQGEYEIKNLASSVKIDGESYKDGSSIVSYMRMNKDPFVPYPIAYKLNADGNINYIDTPQMGANEDDTTLCTRHLGAVDGSLMYKGSSNVNYRRVFGGKYISGNESFLVLIDEQENYDDMDILLGASDDTEYSVDVYSFGNDTPFGDIVLLRGSDSNSVSENVYIFNSMSKVIDETEEHDSLLKIKAYSKSSETSLTVAYGSESIAYGTNVVSENSRTNMTQEEIEACADLKPGDLFRVGLDAKGYVSIIEKLYDYENKLFLNPVASATIENANSSWAGNSSCRLAVGNVYSMTRGYARFSTDEIDLEDPKLESKLEAIYAAGYMYTVDDKGNIQFTQITTGEQILGKKNGEDIKIFIRTEYTRPNMVLFIK